jgi:cytochrome P450
VAHGQDGVEAALLLDPEVLDEPYGFYRRLVEEAPVWPVPGTTVVVVSSFDAISDAVRRPEELSSHIRHLLYRTEAGTPAAMAFDGGPTTDVLATADPPDHTHHRRTVFPELVAKRMADLRPEVDVITSERLDAALAVARTEFMDAVANAVPIRVISSLVGFHEPDHDRLLDAAFASTGLLAATRSQAATLDAMVRTAQIMGWLADQLDETAPDDDGKIIGQIAAAVARGDLDRDAAVVMVHTLLSAGGESTTSLLGNGVHLLARRPDLQDQLRDDPALIGPFVEEMVRLESPFRHHLRHAVADTTLAGVDIPRGSTVLLLWAAANRDPSHFDHPDEVDLSRPTPRPTSASAAASTSASAHPSPASRPRSCSAPCSTARRPSCSTPIGRRHASPA